MKQRLTQLIRTICETILSWLPPDNRFIDEPPLIVAWNPGVAHFCPYCTWTALTFDGLDWRCGQCSGEFRAVPTTDQVVVAPPGRRHTERLPIGELSRKVHIGKITLHGVDELRWSDTDERVNTQQLPTIRMERYSPGE